MGTLQSFRGPRCVLSGREDERISMWKSPMNYWRSDPFEWSYRLDDMLKDPAVSERLLSERAKYSGTSSSAYNDGERPAKSSSSWREEGVKRSMSESPSREYRHKRKKNLLSGSDGRGHDRDLDRSCTAVRERYRRSPSVSPSEDSESFKSMSEEGEERRELTLRPKSDEVSERDVKSDTSGSFEKKRSGSTHSYSTGLPKRKGEDYRREGESERPGESSRGRGKDRLSQHGGGGGDEGHWDKFRKDWQTHTVGHLMTSRGGPVTKGRKGVRRKVTSLPSRYRSKSRR